MKKVMGVSILIGAILCPLLSGESKLSFTRLWPDKIRYLNGESATFEVRLKNSSKEEWRGTVYSEIESLLTLRTPVFRKTVTLGPVEEEVFVEKMTIKLPGFGHALHAVAVSGKGEVVAEGREVICVGRWYYNLGRCITFFGVRKFKSPEEAYEKLVKKWRKIYVTCAEHFSGTPGVWAGMTPKTDEWYSGQGGYPEGIRGEKAVVESAHRNGIAVTVYAQTGSYGPIGEEFARAHPEMLVYNERGRPAGWFNMAKMDFFRTMTEENHKFGTAGGVVPNVALPEVQKQGVDDIIACSRLFGYDGVRWDGDTFGANYDVFGNKVKGDIDELNARWVRYMEERLMSEIPGYTINYNYHPQSQPEGRKLPKTYKEMGPNAYILWESMRGHYKNPNHPLNLWANFIEGVRAEVNKYARPGGNFQHLGWYAPKSEIHANHTQAIYYALGAHWDSWIKMKYDAVSMRYGYYLWDLRLRNANDAGEFLQVDDPEGRLWWRQFAQERALQDGGRELIIHILNKPLKERQSGFEKDAPPVQHNVRATLTLKPGERCLSAFLVNPDAKDRKWQTKLTPRQHGNKVTITIPFIEYWVFVVWKVRK